MGVKGQVAVCAIAIAALIGRANCAWAQAGGESAQGDSAAAAASDQTLEIAPRIAPLPPPPAAPAESATGADGDESATSGDGAPAGDATDAAAPPAPAVNASRPYLGIAVQTIYSGDRPGGLVAGLEVVSVDRDSPAARAGLRGRTKMSSIGESGATVGSLMPPLDLFMMPLLKKTGSLGEGGDLIVAIDDKRVLNDFDLQAELATLKPGDVIYLTVTRAMADGSKQTLKLPIKLGDAAQAAATASADDDATPIAPASAPTQKRP